MLMTLGANPTKAELEHIMHKYRKDSGGVSMVKFLHIYREFNSRQKVSLAGSSNPVLDAFTLFDKNCSKHKDNGMITVDELTRVMITLGGKLQTEEVKEMIKFAKPDKNGNIDYKAFVKKLLNPGSI